MLLHRNAKLGLAGRWALVVAIESGCSMREAARRHGVSPATACSWSRRWRSASEEERRTLSCLHDRSSRPRRSPRMLSATEQARICAERRRSGHGPRLIASRLGYLEVTRFR
jgi:transposase-like protein